MVRRIGLHIGLHNNGSSSSSRPLSSSVPGDLRELLVRGVETRLDAVEVRGNDLGKVLGRVDAVVQAVDFNTVKTVITERLQSTGA